MSSNILRRIVRTPLVNDHQIANEEGRDAERLRPRARPRPGGASRGSVADANPTATDRVEGVSIKTNGARPGAPLCISKKEH